MHYIMQFIFKKIFKDSRKKFSMSSSLALDIHERYSTWLLEYIKNNESNNFWKQLFLCMTIFFLKGWTPLEVYLFTLLSSLDIIVKILKLLNLFKACQIALNWMCIMLWKSFRGNIMILDLILDVLNVFWDCLC